MPRRDLLYLVLPPLLCLLVFYRGLFCWFQQDDFSWLGLEMHSFRDFWRLLVEPQAQGTIRPLSERFFFIAFRRLFDLNAFPYHLFVFLTQFTNLLLLAAVVRKITASRKAAAIASLVWGLNAALVAPMLWASAYNQILCAFFYLLSFFLFLKHVESGRWSFYFWQCAAFLLGFGALETIVAYPVVLFLYCVLLARSQLWKALPLCVPSAFYVAVHLWIIPRAASGPYALHFDFGVARNLATYWAWLFGSTLVVLFTAGLGAGVALAPGKARRLGVFGLAWFLVTLAPVLPLRDHRLDYYLTIPAIGLALTVGGLLASVPRLAAAFWLSAYFACSVLAVSSGTRTLYRKTRTAHRFIEGVRQIRRLHPDKTILLTGVTDSLYYSVVYDDGLRTAGLRDVYLAPTSEGITTRPGLNPPDVHRLPPRAALHALQHDTAVVYQVSEERFQNITNRYRYLDAVALKPTPPRRVDAGAPAMGGELGSGWYEIQQYHRWMGRRAELHLAAPRSAQDRLHMQAYYPQDVSPGPIALTVFANGIQLGCVEVRNNHSGEHFFYLPPVLLGVDEMTITLEANRTFHAPSDPRDLSLAFGIVEIVGP